LIEPVEVHFQWRPQSRDPNDEMVLEAAINGQADALVTYNVADFAGPAERFRISVLRPGDLLKLPLSIKMAAQRLAKEDGVSLNQWIAAGANLEHHA
jgi:predicted nucleic acid-binding protein